MEELDNIITLTDPEGNEIPFEYLDLIEYQGEEYMVLLPVEDEEEDEVLILRIEAGNDPEEENYVSVDDEDLLMTIFGIFKDRFQNEFDFAD